MQGGSDAHVDVEDLVKRAKEGHEASFAALYEHFFDRIFRYVSFKMGNSSEAEDVTGEVFLKMLESIHSFKWQGYPFSSWLFRIANNLVVDHFRKNGKKKTVPLDDMSPTAGAYSSDMDGYVDLKLTMREVQKAMEGLTDLQREVITLRFAADLSVSETALAVGKKDNAVKALQHAGLKKLRNMLGQESSIVINLQSREA